MRRCSYLAVFLMGLCLLAFTGGAQVETLQGLVLTDLQLISQESLPHWTPAWTGPIQGATIAAWFAEHEYPALMHDFNGDGVIDELDTIELADDFGLGNMQTETQLGTTDVRLVIGLATYFAGNYPDEFVLKIYDLSFPTEFAAQGYGTFAPDVIPGIVLELMTEPSIAAYIHELSTGEGVIVGLEEGSTDRNRYLAGRSFLSEQTYEGYTPLDFAWAQEDRWTPGHQGQVLETVGKMEDRFYLDFQGNWTPVEFMLALSPVEEDVETPPEDTPSGCPDLIIRILDDGCVYNPRTEVYNFAVWAEVVNIGNMPVTAPFLVVLNSTTHPGGAAQLIPVPPPLLPGDSRFITLFFSTPPDPSGGAPCPLAYVLTVDAREEIDECDEENNIASGEVCCEDEGGACPDLIVEIIAANCVVGPVAGAPMSQSILTVEAKVTNIGAGAVLVPTTARLRGLGPYSIFDDSESVPPLGPGDAHSVVLAFSIPSDEPVCPLDFGVEADADGDVDECDEYNNNDYGTVCCEDETPVGACCLPDGTCVELTAPECEARDGTQFHPGVDCSVVQCPQPLDECPDLTLSIEDIDCDCDPRKQVCEVVITILVSNIGTQAVTDPMWLEAEAGAVSSMKVIHTDLDPGESVEVEYEYWTSPNLPCIEVDFEIDYIHFIDECDETNNTLTVVECCD